MAKRFTDSEKWSDPWFMDLPNKYKLFWLYLLDSCDHAGIWKVNFKVANFYIGEHLEPSEVKRILGDRIKIIDDTYWHIEKFITFQYGGLKDDNVGKSVKKLLNKHNLLAPNQPLTSPLSGAKDKDNNKDKVKVKAKAIDNTDVVDFLEWGNLIVREEDHIWEQMKGRKITSAELDQFISVAVRNKWDLETQQEFRYALKGFSPMQGSNGKAEANRGKLQ